MPCVLENHFVSKAVVFISLTVILKGNLLEGMVLLSRSSGVLFWSLICLLFIYLFLLQFYFSQRKGLCRNLEESELAGKFN